MKKWFLIFTLAAFSIPAISQKRIPQVRTKEELLNEEYCSGLFNTQHGDYFDLLDDRVNASALAYLNVLDWLQGRVAGLNIYNTKNNLRLPFIRNQRATVYVDEIRMDYDYLNMLPVSDIAMIKIIKGPFVGAWDGTGGAIVIYTIRGEGNDEKGSGE
jgi:hypothetical protein